MRACGSRCDLAGAAAATNSASEGAMPARVCRRRVQNKRTATCRRPSIVHAATKRVDTNSARDFIRSFCKLLRSCAGPPCASPSGHRCRHGFLVSVAVVVVTLRDPRHVRRDTVPAKENPCASLAAQGSITRSLQGEDIDGAALGNVRILAGKQRVQAPLHPRRIDAPAGLDGDVLLAVHRERDRRRR